MFNANDILARLQSGENPEAIANEMADCLNHAIDMHNAAKLEKTLEKTLDCAASDVSTYLKAKFPKGCEALDFELDGEDLGEILDAIMTILPMIDMFSDLQDMIPTPITKKSCAPPCGCHDGNDPIKAFLSEMGLLQ